MKDRPVPVVDLDDDRFYEDAPAVPDRLRAAAILASLFTLGAIVAFVVGPGGREPARASDPLGDTTTTVVSTTTTTAPPAPASLDGAPPPAGCEDDDRGGAALRAKNSAKVIPANGTGIAGLAGRYSDRLAALDYRTGRPLNGDRTDRTRILYAAGYCAEAVVMAEDLGLDVAPEALGIRRPPVEEPSLVDRTSIILLLGPDAPR